LNARQKRMFEEARKRNPDLKMPTDKQAPADLSDADLALIKQRRMGSVVRVEIESHMPEELRGFILEEAQRLVERDRRRDHTLDADGVQLLELAQISS